ncbi:hypothetical protein JM654_20600 [Microbacterium oxydans]|nr:hypothetical protein [Microbacterium oxydans]
MAPSRVRSRRAPDSTPPRRLLHEHGSLAPDALGLRVHGHRDRDQPRLLRYVEAGDVVDLPAADRAQAAPARSVVRLPARPPGDRAAPNPKYWYHSCHPGGRRRGHEEGECDQGDGVAPPPGIALRRNAAAAGSS